MKIISKPSVIQKKIRVLKSHGRTVGLVPTMGALHEGHLSLIKRSVAENDVTVVSIFVNPAQFGPAEDYSKYPRPFAKDASVCRRAGVDMIFAPRPADMYPEGYLTYISVEKITDIMCGFYRPGHFRGVATVVAKLFNISMPDKAYFGLKDYQQFVVIKKMATDLNFPVSVAACPIVRGKDGLALSSRNAYLSPEERKKALSLSASLQNARNLIKYKDVVSVAKIISGIKNALSGSVSRIDYVEVRDAATLAELKSIDRKKRAVIAVAAFVGKTRLIDNVIV